MENKIKEISFEEILPTWKNFLWPERISVIEEVSCIDQSGKIDVSIRQFSSVFFGCISNEELTGVISCHPISRDIMRIRGIYVFQIHRNKGLGRQLISKVIEFSHNRRFQKIFGLVREKNEQYFEGAGFYTYSNTDAFEYGPHVLMEFRL